MLRSSISSSCRGACKVSDSRRHLQPAVQPRKWRTFSSNGDPEPVAGITKEQACSLLGVSGATAGFEEILIAKNKLVAANAGNQKKVIEIEAAYDVLFMESMKKRMSGELEISSSVRYADVPTKKRGGSRSAPAQSSLLQKLPGGGISLEPPAGGNVLLVQSAVFGGLSVWAVVQVLLEGPEAQAADTGGLQLALAAAYAIYSFKENKRLALGRSVGLTFGSLVAGVLVGAVLNQWLQLDIVPIGSFGSPGVFVTDCAIAAIWAGCALLA